jgi:hypothetical protein
MSDKKLPPKAQEASDRLAAAIRDAKDPLRAAEIKVPEDWEDVDPGPTKDEIDAQADSDWDDFLVGEELKEKPLDADTEAWLRDVLLMPYERTDALRRYFAHLSGYPKKLREKNRTIMHLCAIILIGALFAAWLLYSGKSDREEADARTAKARAAAKMWKQRHWGAHNAITRLEVMQNDECASIQGEMQLLRLALYANLVTAPQGLEGYESDEHGMYTGPLCFEQAPVRERPGWWCCTTGE